METSQWALSENVPRLRTLLLRVGSHHRAAHPISVVWHESQVVQGQGAIDLPTTNCRETHGSFRLGESLHLMWERWQANVGIRAYDNTCCRLLQHGSVAVVVLKTFGSKSGCFFHHWLLGHRLIHGKYMSLGEIGSWVVREITLHWAGGMWKCWRRSLSPSFCQVGSDQNPWWLVLIAVCTVGVINVYWGLS